MSKEAAGPVLIKASIGRPKIQIHLDLGEIYPSTT